MKKQIMESIVKRIKNKLILEGSTDKPILDISRIVVSMFLRKTEGKFKYVLYRSGEEVKIKVIVTLEEIENHNEPFEVLAEAFYDQITFNIKYDPDEFPKSMNDFVAEIKESTTHEIEHILQAHFEDTFINPFESDYDHDKRGGKFNYFLKKIEIPAFVKGLIKRANTKKITLDQAMDEWYEENYRNFESFKDWKDVKKIWMDFAKENLSKQKVKKFK